MRKTDGTREDSEMNKLADCSRCMGVFLAGIVLAIAAYRLDEQALKELLIAGMGLASLLVGFGAGSNARGKGPETQPGTTTATMVATDSAVASATRSLPDGTN